MKSKGFTLVELIMVIVLIAILFALALPSALKFSARTKERTKNARIELIEKASIIYAEDIARSTSNNCRFVPADVTNGECYELTLDELYADNYINKEDLIDPTKQSKIETENKLTGSIEVQWYDNRYYAVYHE